MSRGSICAQLFGFVVLLAALLAWPQAVRAHAGHAHAAHVHTHAQHATAAASADQHLEQHAEEAIASAVHGETDGTNGTPCSRGCCAQSSCAACFSMVAPMPPLVAPPSLSTEMTFAANRLPPGIDGASLRRPPRSFA